jgi:hypothetical protein
MPMPVRQAKPKTSGKTPSKIFQQFSFWPWVAPRTG